MDKKLQNIIFNIVKAAEIFIALILSLAIIVCAFKMIFEIINVIDQPVGTETFDKMLSYAFSLVIGVEFVKMICKYTPSIVIEVLLFTVARYLVVNHSSAISTLFGVTSIAGIFAIKKYLFSNFEEDLNKNIDSNE